MTAAELGKYSVYAIVWGVIAYLVLRVVLLGIDQQEAELKRKRAAKLVRQQTGEYPAIRVEDEEMVA